ncbi:MAG: DUF1365 domain-containing protein [Bacillota bacterium]
MNESALYYGEVMHRRLGRLRYFFAYKVFSLFADIDELPVLHRRLRLFSHNRFNLFSLHDRDHGGRDGAPLRPWIEALLKARGVDLDGGRIQLLCFPRILGYVFNPMCVWYCRHRDGSLRALVCEVRNTSGGMHHYVLADGGRPLAWDADYRAHKVFHVSPFVPSEAEYRFRFREPKERMRVYINEFAGGTALLQASIAGSRLPLTDATLLYMFARLPFMTLKVIAAIHWQALKIWLRGGRFHRMPKAGLYAGTLNETDGWTAQDA